MLQRGHQAWSDSSHDWISENISNWLGPVEPNGLLPETAVSSALVLWWDNSETTEGWNSPKCSRNRCLSRKVHHWATVLILTNYMNYTVQWREIYLFGGRYISFFLLVNVDIGQVFKIHPGKQFSRALKISTFVYDGLEVGAVTNFLKSFHRLITG